MSLYKLACKRVQTAWKSFKRHTQEKQPEHRKKLENKWKSVLQFAPQTVQVRPQHPPLFQPVDAMVDPVRQSKSFGESSLAAKRTPRRFCRAWLTERPNRTWTNNSSSSRLVQKDCPIDTSLPTSVSYRNASRHIVSTWPISTSGILTPLPTCSDKLVYC
jgi:hypothetical protein